MKTRNINILLIIIILIPFFLSSINKNEIIKIEIFYLPWNMKTVDDLYPNDVRNHSRVSKYVIDQKNEIDTLKKILSPVKLRFWKYQEYNDDIRMVIDFHHKSGDTTTYLLNGMHYLSVKIGDTLYRANLDFYNWVNNKLPDPMMKFPGYKKDSIKGIYIHIQLDNKSRGNEPGENIHTQENVYLAKRSSGTHLKNRKWSE